MSFTTPTGLPPIDPSLEPASVRSGPPAAKRAYGVALGFEQMLVDQLSQELAASTQSSGSDPTSSDGSGTDSSSGLLGSDPASSAYSSLIPQALTSSIMSAGGVGIAQQLAGAIDPALIGKQSPGKR
jgi:hypothetical protein